MPAPEFLLCPPDHYGVNYVINPHMQPAEWHRDPAAHKAEAVAQWRALHATMQGLGWRTQTIAPTAGLPDMVFAANLAFVLDDLALIAKFATEERAAEAPLAASWFGAQGYAVHQSSVVQEGAGDILYDRAVDTIFVGGGDRGAPYDFRRSEPATVALVADLYGRRTVHLPLVNPYFYHLDTCFCPLGEGHALYAPAAFDETGTRQLRGTYGDRLIPVTDDDAMYFACNAVVVGRDIAMPRVSRPLTERLHGLGYRTHQHDLGGFIMAGGASRCLTLRLDD